MSQEKIPEKVQEAIFNKLLSRAADAECADCRNKAPTWVSLDFGVFVCIRCSGVHRQLGPHITRVRSTRLDGWTKDNIEIMEAVGNKLANDFYEYRMPSGYRKPNANSTPEECRRFVDEKYIRKGFAPPGHQEPVKEFLACRKKGVNPEFGFSRGNQQTQEKHQDTKVMRKKSMSLERLPETHHEKKVQQQPPKQNQQQQQHASHHVDFLTADDDLLGGGSHDDFGDFKQATQSASPIKKQDHFNINANNGQEIQQQQQQNQNQWNWNFNAGQNQGQNNNQSPPQNMQQQQNPQNVQNMQQQPAENKVDFMKLYNQPQMNQMQGHQNHFMQMQQGGMQGGWNAHHNNGWHSAGHYGTQQQQQPQFQQGGFQQQQGFQNNMNMGNMGGFNNNAGFNQQNMGYGMGGMGMQQQNMGYGYGQQQGQFNNNMMQNQQGFAQMSGNRFF